jgi:hypothetical protein
MARSAHIEVKVHTAGSKAQPAHNASEAVLVRTKSKALSACTVLRARLACTGYGVQSVHTGSEVQSAHTESVARVEEERGFSAGGRAMVSLCLLEEL